MLLMYLHLHKSQQKKMEQRRRSSSSSGHCLHLLLVLLVLCFSGSVKAYKNYTVGDSLGWFDTLEKPTVDYQKWVSGKVFSLGDFLIFNTDNNHSVIQTYNFTTYKLCDYDDAPDDKATIQWSASDPSAIEPHPVSVAVPLVKEGMTYFFSSDYDGEQCKNGQNLKINVTHGQGLPKSLSNSPDSPSPASPIAGDDESAPDTIVPSNFNNPHEEEESDDGDEKAEKSGSVSMSLLVSSTQVYNTLMAFSLVLMGLVILF